MKITIEIDDKELKGLLFGEVITRPKITNRYQDVIYETMLTADKVLGRMTNIAEEYGCITVDGFIDILHDEGVDCFYKKSNSPVLFGWKHEDLMICKVIKIRYGYIIDLTDPVQL